jgi:RNA polymerase primary sigma factor
MRKFVITTKITDKTDENFNRYLKEISLIEPFTKDEETEYFKRVVNGDEEAVQEIVKRNLRFVVSVAKQYTNQHNPIGDLINEGNYGLLIAVRNFKPEMGFKFISYAIWWIRKSIINHITNNGRLIRIPANKMNTLSKLEKEISALEQKYGRNVTPNEAIEFFIDDLDSELINEVKKTKKEFATVSNINTGIIESLDRDLSGDEDNSLLLSETISDNMFDSIEDVLMEVENKKKIHKALDVLKPRDKKVMISLFGLDGDFPKTLSDVADDINLTREMVRQIRNKSLNKLKETLSV